MPVHGKRHLIFIKYFVFNWVLKEINVYVSVPNLLDYENKKLQIFGLQYNNIV